MFVLRIFMKKEGAGEDVHNLDLTVDISRSRIVTHRSSLALRSRAGDVAGGPLTTAVAAVLLGLHPPLGRSGVPPRLQAADLQRTDC